MPSSSVSELLNRKITPEQYHDIRRLWQVHSIAEDRRDIPGLISTLTEDCVYELAQTGKRWVGHKGAEQFYTELLTAFPDIHFDLQRIVIGPQGVFEEAHVTGTHKGPWLRQQPTGQPIEFDVLILFPWDAERKRFKGELVWFHFSDSSPSEGR